MKDIREFKVGEILKLKPPVTPPEHVLLAPAALTDGPHAMCFLQPWGQPDSDVLVASLTGEYEQVIGELTPEQTANLAYE